MRTVVKASAVVAVLLVGVLMLSSTASASSGTHWGPSYLSNTATSWTDHHGQNVNITVNWWIYQNMTITSGNSNFYHAANSVCNINGTPAYVEYAGWQYGSTWSISDCTSQGGSVYAGSPRTWY